MSSGGMSPTAAGSAPNGEAADVGGEQQAQLAQRVAAIAVPSSSTTRIRKVPTTQGIAVHETEEEPERPAGHCDSWPIAGRPASV